MEDKLKITLLTAGITLTSVGSSILNKVDDWKVIVGGAIVCLSGALMSAAAVALILNQHAAKMEKLISK